jgi:hypothetical protein
MPGYFWKKTLEEGPNFSKQMVSLQLIQTQEEEGSATFLKSAVSLKLMKKNKDQLF